MPVVSEAQRRAMWAAESGHSSLGIPKEVATKFLTHDFASLAANSAIPAGVRKLAVDADTAFDMTDEDWRGLIEGLVKFFGEERREPEHALDAMAMDRAVIARDRIAIAMDRDLKNRFLSKDGHLHVPESNISRAVVSPYRGEEIPDWEALGLDKDGVYQLLRDPKELEKAAASFNGKPLLSKHKPISAAAHPNDLVIGSVSNPVYDHPWLKAELVVWPKSSIDEIENKSKHEISCGYRYKAVMEPGEFEGVPYHGRMTDIDGNHVSLVVDGRVPGAVVGDSALEDSAAIELYWNLIEQALQDHVGP